VTSKSIGVKELRKELSDVLGRVAFGHERVVIKRSGKNCAAVVPIADLELLEKLEDEIDLREAQRRLAEEGDLARPFEEVVERLGL
jgi:prevent-host-death family protein